MQRLHLPYYLLNSHSNVSSRNLHIDGSFNVLVGGCTFAFTPQTGALVMSSPWLLITCHIRASLFVFQARRNYLSRRSVPVRPCMCSHAVFESASQ
jgi:hypothetical protein